MTNAAQTPAAPARTIQLRRYEIVPGTLDAFVEWFQERLVPARESEGFTIEFAYADRAVEQFVWAVSAEGDAEAFLALEAEYLESAARAAAFDGVPQRVAAHHIRLVDRVV